MDTFVPAVILGIGQGAFDSLLAVGIVLIFRTSGVLNFAQAATGTLSAYVIYAVSQRAPLTVAVAAGIVAGALTGVATCLAVTGSRARNRALTTAVATLAFAILLQQVVRIGWGSTAGQFPSPFGFASITLGSTVIAYLHIYSLVVAAVLALGLGATLRWTSLGTMVRALADNPDAAALCGAPVGLLVAGVWALAGALAAGAGFFAAQITFDPFFLDPFFIASLIAAVLAGLRSIPAAFVAAIALECSYNLFQTYAPASLTGYTETFLVALLIAALVLAPRAWLAHEAVRTV